MGEELETVFIRKLGVLPFAITITLVAIFSSIVFFVVIALLVGLIASMLPSGSELILEMFSSFFSFEQITNFLKFLLGISISTFLFGVIFALLYNLAAKITKGIKLFS
ncbi:MAG: hypothetical protein WC238_06015 [Parcubacteria group bacterium]|jgi:hypothetical protein